MENKAKYPKYDFLTAQARMKLLFGTKMSEDDFLEKAMITWNDMPDRHIMSHIYIGTIDANNVIEIPDNVEYIKAVTTPSEIYDIVEGRFNEYMFYYNGSRFYSSIRNEFNWDNYRVNGSIDDRFGDNITYELIDSNVLQFKQGDLAGMHIAVLYKGLLVNDDCDPLLYDKEVTGIATNVAYMDCMLRANSGDPLAIKMLPVLEAKANLAITRSGIADKVTEAQFDRALNIKTSHDRKVHNKKYKFRS